MKFFQQLNAARKDILIASLLVLSVFIVVIKVNLAETLAERLAKYEHLQLDEIPFLLLFIAIGLAWFSWRRMVEQKKEIALRVLAEEQSRDLLRENKSLMQHILRVQEFERLELARDLHDDIGQYLLAIRLDASFLTIGNSNNLHANRILSNAGHIQNMAKSLMRRLRPAPTDSKNCVDGIHLLVQEWQELQPDIHVELYIGDSMQLFTAQSSEQKGNIATEQISVTLYRFIQEALTNIAKHAQAKQVRVSLDIINGLSARAGDAQCLCLDITDDGKGLDVQTASSGIGMIGMRERISAVNGEFLVKKNHPHGLIVCAKIPFHMTNNN